MGSGRAGSRSSQCPWRLATAIDSYPDSYAARGLFCVATAARGIGQSRLNLGRRMLLFRGLDRGAQSVQSSSEGGELGLDERGVVD